MQSDSGVAVLHAAAPPRSARSPRVARRGTRALVLLLAALVGSASAVAQAVAPLTEAQAKAAFVLNFARYVDWPPGAFPAKDTPVTACVAGRDTIGPALSALEGRPVQGRSLKVRRNVGIDTLSDCHLVFISEPEERRIAPVLHALAGQPVLTVSDSDRFVEIGGHIAIVVVDERLQFEIGRSALEQSQLKAGAPLLKLARNVP